MKRTVLMAGSAVFAAVVLASTAHSLPLTVANSARHIDECTGLVTVVNYRNRHSRWHSGDRYSNNHYSRYSSGYRSYGDDRYSYDDGYYGGGSGLYLNFGGRRGHNRNNWDRQGGFGFELF